MASHLKGAILVFTKGAPMGRLAGLAWPGRPGLAGRKTDRFFVKYGLMDFHMGRQGLGCGWVESYWCQDSFPSLVGPFGAMGWSVRGRYVNFWTFLSGAS